jgi:hypothetical protein
VRITSIEGQDARVRIRSASGQVRIASLGDGVVLRPGDQIELLGGPDAEAEVETSQTNTLVSSWQGVQCSNGAGYTGSVEDEDGDGPLQQSVMQTTCGEAEVTPAGAGEQALHQAGTGFALTPETGARVSGRARLVRDPRRGLTTVSGLRGGTQVTPANPALRGLRLVPGQGVRVSRTAISAPFPLVPDLQNEIPSPRQVRAGPALVTAPSRLSLRSLRSSKCVRVLVASTKPARVLVTIFSGRRSVRLFGQRLVTFAAPGRKVTCILVPRRARTFNVRTPLSFAVGYALGARARPGQRAARPVIRPIALVP